MKEKITTERMLVWLVFFLVGIWSGVKLFTPEIKEGISIKETIKTDTVYVKADTVFMDKATVNKPIAPKNTRPKDPETDPQPEKYDSIRTYSGTYTLQYGKLDWKISTGGILESYEFHPQFELPVVTVTKEITVTKTNTVTQKGLYAGGGMNTSTLPHVGATYLGKKFLVEYNYTPAGIRSLTVPVHQVGLKYKIL